MKLEDTGERIIPDEMKPSNLMLLEHMARYQFAFPYVKGRVLDLACGSGYGSVMAAKQSKRKITSMTAVDFSQEAITYARGRYHHPMISYECHNAVDRMLPKKLGMFDCILSFETYEHIVEEDAFLENLYQMLKPGGTLVISTPFGEGRGKPSSEPFHIHQITKDEFTSLFDRYAYGEKTFYYQSGVLVEPLREGMNYQFGIAVCQKGEEQ
ncbi:class I SAM-dependent methyltransferase [Jeotgalibacillus terrae]|uniref:Class I SAM-dependent methyltransferase n=1 Tax=Jeotgalibacillus terrae TaxID=587735 RepID=A0ABW5ZGK8_9BACL|nr:methyltransferase domain-containing protein [Jeotgalibacillus terrae]MBM7578491.1 2-polyprenyl-3-methyl-5-hydroxy-6-metoxy-1,4-benzoquinol methylase [Jeotgalibacillus terrae]